MSDEVKPHYKDFFLYILIIIIAVVAVIFLFSKNYSTTQNSTISESSGSINMKHYDSSPKMTLDQSKKYFALIDTNKGQMKINLFSKETPVTVNNFVFLSKEGFYNGTNFHRIVSGFMIQGGDPKGDGTGGPGYNFPDEKITRDYKRGIVAMANSGPNTNGSQFFIMHQDYNLPKQYVIFGQITDGLNTLDKIAGTPTVDNGQGEKSKPTEKVTIDKLTISEE